MSESQTEGEARAQAFHDGLEAGMRAGVDLMRDAVVRKFKLEASQSYLDKDLLDLLAYEVSKLDPFKTYDSSH